MEKIYSIKQTHKNNNNLIEKGYFIEVECCMCLDTVTFAGKNKQEVLSQMTNNGWRYIDSDKYMLSGLHCGCDYMD